jgi:hypothetical protein
VRHQPIEEALHIYSEEGAKIIRNYSFQLNICAGQGSSVFTAPHPCDSLQEGQTVKGNRHPVTAIRARI